MSKKPLLSIPIKDMTPEQKRRYGAAHQQKYRKKMILEGLWKFHKGDVKKQRRKHMPKWRERYPDKLLAHQKVYRAVKLGILTRPNMCSICGKENGIIMGHHDDYKKPLDVRWVCGSCHIAIHAQDLGGDTSEN